MPSNFRKAPISKTCGAPSASSRSPTRPPATPANRSTGGEADRGEAARVYRKAVAEFLAGAGCPDSGSPQHPARLPKISHVFLCKAVYMPALMALHKAAWGKVSAVRLTRAGKPQRLIIGARRKLLQVAFGVLRSGQPLNPALPGAWLH